jgi:hypothetical protein
MIESGMNPVSTIAMNQAAMNTNIQRSIACARGVPDKTSGRGCFPAKPSAIVAIGVPPSPDVPRRITILLCVAPAFHPHQPLVGWDEDHRSARSRRMSDEAAHLRSQARRCRRLALNVSTDKDQAMLKRVAKDFDEAADELEKKPS